LLHVWVPEHVLQDTNETTWERPADYREPVPEPDSPPPDAPKARCLVQANLFSTFYSNLIPRTRPVYKRM
jgi:hypothetical protein